MNTYFFIAPEYPFVETISFRIFIYYSKFMCKPLVFQVAFLYPDLKIKTSIM
jgi:hypothetical protein